MSKVKLLKVKNKNDSSKNTLTTFQKNEEEDLTSKTKMIQQIEKNENDWYLYELFSVQYHQNTLQQVSYHWHNISEEILFDSGIIRDFTDVRMRRKDFFEKGLYYHPLKDLNYDESIFKKNKRREYGLDGLAIEYLSEDKSKYTYHGIQCKLYKKSSLRPEDLGTFYSSIFLRLGSKFKDAKGYLYYDGKITKDLEYDLNIQNDKIIGTHLPFDSKKMIQEKQVKIQKIEGNESKFELYSAQKDAVKTLENDWEGCGLLHMPCGTGKTIVFLNHVKNMNYEHVFILSPLRVHTKQNLDRAKNFLNQGVNKEEQHEYCLIDSDSDGTRNFLDVLKYFENGHCVYSSTYKSCEDVLSQFFYTEEETKMMDLENIDEDDNLENENESEEEDFENESTFSSFSKTNSEINSLTSSQNFNKIKLKPKYDLSNSLLIVDECHNILGNKKLKQIINSFPKVLLVSATPPCEIHEEMNCNTLYSYSMEKAILEKRICDYKIYLPWIHQKEDLSFELMMNIPLELNKLNKDLCIKILFLIKGMLEKGSKKCIVYLSSIQECSEFIEVFKQVVNKYHYISFWISSITSDTNEKNRETILKEFLNIDENQLDKLYVLCSIRILDECIDITKCDSVYLTNIGEKSSDIRTVQRICRANRKDFQNPNKIANVFLWTEDHNKIINSLKLLKENDLNFSKKISILKGNYENVIKKDSKNVEKDFEKDQINLLKFVEVKCLSLQEIFDKKILLLFEYCNIFKTHPKQSVEYKDIKLGVFYNSLKQSKIKEGNQEVYDLLIQNEYLKKDLDRFIEEQKKEKKEKLFFDEKISLLFEYCNTFKKHPSLRVEYKDIKLGHFYNYLKQSKIKKGNKEIYDLLIQNEYLKKDLDQFIEYQNKEKKEELSFEEKISLLFEYCNTFKTYPKRSVEYKDIKLGVFYDTLKQSKIKKGNKELYDLLIQNEYLKKDLDQFIEDQNKEKKEELSFEEKISLLFEYCNTFKTHPKGSVEYKDIKLGIFYDTLKQSKIKKGNQEIYDLLIQNDFLKKDLDRFIEDQKKKYYI